MSTTPKKVIQMETTTNNASRVLKRVATCVSRFDMSKARYFDCSGLVIWLLQQLGLIKTDYTANGIYNSLCYAISKKELKDGDLCFISSDGKKTHVGIYSTKYGVIESNGRDTGVIESEMSSKWTVFARLRCLQ